MRFEWDERKNHSNREKHGLGFETAQEVFKDPLHLSKLDLVVGHEQRWRTIGAIGDLMLVVVAHTVAEDEDGEEVIRIISARLASRKERRDYENC